MTVVSRRKEIEDRLLTVLNGAGAGLVLRGQHRLDDPEDFYRALAENQNKNSGERGEFIIKGWQLYRISREDVRGGTAGAPGVATNHVGINHIYKLDGIYGFDPKTRSEEAFNEMVDTMMNVLADSVRVATDDGYDLRIIAGRASLDLETVGDIEAHVAEITFTVQENVTRT